MKNKLNKPSPLYMRIWVQGNLEVELGVQQYQAQGLEFCLLKV